MTIIGWVVSDESYMIMSGHLSSEQTVFPPALIVIIVLLVIMLSKHSYYRSARIILHSDS